MTRIIAAIALLALTGACSGQSKELAEVRDFAMEDLRAAQVLAGMGDNPDTMALQCYAYLEPQLELYLNPPEGADIAGPLSAYQTVRNTRRLIESVESEEFRMSCGPMLMDSQAAAQDLLSQVLGLF